MLTVRGQQHSFLTHEQMFLWKCQSFLDKKCLDLRGTRTPNLRVLDWIQPMSPCNTVSYHKMVFTVWQLQRYNIGRTWDAENSTHMSSSRNNSGVSCDYVEEKITLMCVGRTGLHCSCISSFMNSLRPSDAIWLQRTMLTLPQVMACCLTAPSHYLNQSWLILWRSCEDNLTRDSSAITHQN